MKLKSSILILLLWVSASNVVAQTTESENIATLTYDQLYTKRADYIGKVLRVKAFHVYGFEWSFLCGTNCTHGEDRVWVDFVDEDDLCKGSRRKLKAGSQKYFDNRADVIYIGKLSSGQFGHFGVYPYQLTVSCVEKFKRMPPLN